MTAGSLALPDLEVDVALLRRFFRQERSFPELRNPHIEPRVPDGVRAKAKPSAVLMTVVDDPGGARMIVTRRHRNLRFAGHVCFPGGKIDAGDADAVAAALREAEEEIGLSPDNVDLLGRLGDYYTPPGAHGESAGSRRHLRDIPRTGLPGSQLQADLPAKGQGPLLIS